MRKYLTPHRPMSQNVVLSHNMTIDTIPTAKHSSNF